eukprot:tig00001368_g8406.t1
MEVGGAPGPITFEGGTVHLEGRPLGRGQYGVVYRGQLDGQVVAVKILKDGVFGERLAQARADLEREVKIMRSLDHPNIIRLIGSGCADAGEGGARCGKPFLITEYGGTRTLRTLIDGLVQQPLPFSVKESIMLQCLEAVAHMHGRGFAHHDLKPDNIFLLDRPQPPPPPQPRPAEAAPAAAPPARKAASGLGAELRRAEASRGRGAEGGEEEAVAVKVGDLGLADVVGGEVFRRGKGTVLYAAPESFEHRMDFGSDLWSLGVVFYQLASGGELPFQGRNDSGLRRSIAEEEVRPIAPRHAVPPLWSHLILSGLLVRDPSRRVSAPAALALLHEHRLHGSPGPGPGAPHSAASSPALAPLPALFPPSPAARGLGRSLDERAMRAGAGRLSRRAIADEVHRRLTSDAHAVPASPPPSPPPRSTPPPPRRPAPPPAPSPAPLGAGALGPGLALAAGRPGPAGAGEPGRAAPPTRTSSPSSPTSSPARGPAPGPAAASPPAFPRPPSARPAAPQGRPAPAGLELEGIPEAAGSRWRPSWPSPRGGAGGGAGEGPQLQLSPACPASPSALQRTASGRSSSGSLLNLALLAAAGGSSHGATRAPAAPPAAAFSSPPRRLHARRHRRRRLGPRRRRRLGPRGRRLAAGGDAAAAAGGSLRGGEAGLSSAESLEAEGRRRGHSAKRATLAGPEGGLGVHRSASKHGLDLAYLRSLVDEASGAGPGAAPGPLPLPVEQP